MNDKLSLAHFESSMNWGGQELRIIEQTEWLLNYGHSVWIIARPGSAILAEAEKRQLPYLSLVVRGALSPKTLYVLFVFLCRKKIQILDCHSNKDAYYGFWLRCLSRLGLLNGLKVVRSRHVADPIRTKGLRKWVWIKGCDFIITTAEAINDIIATAGLAPPKKIYAAIAGVDPQRFNPDIDSCELKQQLGIPAKNIVIANIGMIRPDKGQKYFVAATLKLAQKHPNLTFIQVGAATKQTKAYEKKVLAIRDASPYADRIKFLGYRSDIENYLALADMVVISSIATEAQTRLVSQAFLMKKNIVATRTGGLPEMIEHEVTGLLCEAKNSQALEETIDRLLSDQNKRLNLQQQAYEYALKNMTTKVMMAGMLNTYKNVLMGNSKC